MSFAYLRHLWLHRRVPLIGFLLAVLLLAVFLVRLTVAAVYWSDPEHVRQSPEHWMTPRYVARSWDMPPDRVAEALGLDPETHPRRQTLAAIAEARGVPVEVLIGDLSEFLNDTRP